MNQMMEINLILIFELKIPVDKLNQTSKIPLKGAKHLISEKLYRKI